MMRALFLALLVLSTSVSASLSAPALWRVSKGRTDLWLYGSVHILRPQTDWRTSVFDNALATSSKVYFETDVGVNAQAAIAKDLLRMSMYEKGQSLDQSLSAQDMALVETAAQQVMVPAVSVRLLKPWYSASILSVTAVVQAGYVPEYGVEFIVNAEIPPGKADFLETPLEQLSILAGAPENEQISFLLETAKLMPEIVPLTDQMVDAWMMGDQDGLQAIIDGQLDGMDPAFSSALLDERNARWMKDISAILDGDEDTMMIVGAAHFLGEQGLIRLLERKGLQVERVQ